MHRQTLLILAVLLAAGRPAYAVDVPKMCIAYGEAKVVFVGRAHAPVHYTLSVDVGLDQARKRLTDAEGALERYRVSIGDPLAHAAGPGGHPHNQVRSALEADLYARALDALDRVLQAEAMTTKPQDLLVTPMDVEARFRGVTAPVVLLFGGPPLEPGRSYLIYGDHPFFGSDVVGQGPESREIDSAADDLNYLYSAAGSSETIIHGVLRFRDSDASDAGLPFSGITIRVSSGGWNAETITGADGSFVIPGAPPAHVELSAQLPKPFAILKQASTMPEPQGGGCVDWSLTVGFNGQVRGHLSWEDGRPLTHAAVDLLPLDTRRTGSTPDRDLVTTNESGEFEFVGRSPGKYLLGVNLSKVPTSGFPYAPTYFPGTTDRALATPIVLGLGTVLDGMDFRLSDPLPRGQLEIRLDTGNAPQSHVYACVGPPDHDGGVYRRSGGDPLLVNVVEGGQYLVEIHADTPLGHVHSGPIQFQGVRGRTLLTLEPDPRSEGHATGSECGRAVDRSSDVPPPQ